MKLSPTTATLGFPRMGPRRELKFALEKHWQGKLDLNGLIAVSTAVTDQSWELQKNAGIDRITVGDNYLYDGILSWTDALGIVSSRHRQLHAGSERMFAMARGVDGITALSMKKWITSNYHYMVPEYDGMGLQSPDFSSFLAEVKRGATKLSPSCATPVVIGPVTLAYLTKYVTFSQGYEVTLMRKKLLDELIPLYQNLLQSLADMNVAEIQIHEAVLVMEDPSLLDLFKHAYPLVLPKRREGPAQPLFNIVSFMDDVGVEHYKWLCSVKEFGILSLDFTRGENLDHLKKFGFPSDKLLGAGVVDSRSVWSVQPAVVVPIIETLTSIVSDGNRVRIQPSGSLQFVPWELSCEKPILVHPAGPVLSFATEKLLQIRLLADTDFSASNPLPDLKQAWDTYHKSVSLNTNVQNRLKSLTERDLKRSEPFEIRRTKQFKNLPVLPTTTIGSFPQTNQIRKLRSDRLKNLITEAEYNAAIDQQIALCIGIQEGLGLDILVHGEPERTDMVEFFGQQMEGILFTSNGWVQSFGSRCVRPPIIWSDVYRPNPMTVREYKVAQALTTKPVKGMLTGPVTILNWSFPRVDISRKEQAMQLGLCIQDEITDLEAAGCVVVQVDEPALREAMPLKAVKKQEYLNWAVDSFLLATSKAASTTQIHTHMCYCEFDDCMDAIDRMDTDVNSIENARSDNSTLLSFQKIGYTKGLGPGTYDIHSPVIPPVSFIVEKIHSFLECMDPKQLVVNPDCGLKTRTWPETIAALQNLVKATHDVRAGLN